MYFFNFWHLIMHTLSGSRIRIPSPAPNIKYYLIFLGMIAIELNRDMYKDIKNGHRKVEEWADKVGPEIIEINNEKDYNFLNINTKKDLEEAKNKIK